MKAADRRPWTAGGRPGRPRARGAGRPWTGPERANQGGAAERGRGRGAGRAESAWLRGRRPRSEGRRGDGRATTGERPRSHPPHPPGTGGGGGVRHQTRGPRSGGHRSARGRRTPPTCSWGVRRPRGGQDARPIRARMALGRRQAPRRPHDAGRPMRAVAGIRGRRRPARGGRP